MSSDQFSPRCVFDFGSGFSKCGFSGDDAPSSLFETIVGRPKNPGIMVGMDMDYHSGIGRVRGNRRRGGIIVRKYPVIDGIWTNFNDMERVIHHSFYNELRVEPESHSTLILESIFSPKGCREKKTSIMFETFNCPEFSMLTQSVTSLFLSGISTGLVVESGDGCTQVSGVIDSQLLPKTRRKMKNLCGRELTETLSYLLTLRGYVFITTEEKLLVRDMKEKLCFVSLDYEKELNISMTSSILDMFYELPDGQVITLGGIERFQTTELYFQPLLLRDQKQKDMNESKGIHEIVLDSVHEIQREDVQKRLLHNIVLSGDSTMFPGFGDRLQSEIRKKKDAKVFVSEESKKKYSAWVGASIMSSLSSFRSQCITKDEYEENGPSFIERKCPIGLTELREKTYFEKDVDERERTQFLLENFKDVTSVLQIKFTYNIIVTCPCYLMVS